MSNEYLIDDMALLGRAQPWGRQVYGIKLDPPPSHNAMGNARVLPKRQELRLFCMCTLLLTVLMRSPRAMARFIWLSRRCTTLAES